MRSSFGAFVIVISAAQAWAGASILLARQLPPSVRASVPTDPAFTDEERAQLCPSLLRLAETVKRDATWSKQPLVPRELRDLEDAIRNAGCAFGQLEGTWAVTGKGDTDPAYQESLTLTATAVDEQAAYDFTDKWFGPNELVSLCRYANTFYTGTLTWSSDAPWRRWGYNTREASFVACANSAGPNVNGRFSPTPRSPKFSGNFLLHLERPGEGTGDALSAGTVGVDWTLKKIK